MASNRTFRHLPEVFQTETQRKFFDATFEQLFSSKNSEKVDGFIGRRVPGNYDPINDYFLQEPTKERTWNMLEPISVSLDDNTLATTNVSTLEDLTNRITFLRGETDNKDRLFSSDYYCFAPPVDIDKFINYYVYFWVLEMPTAGIPGLSDFNIEEDIIGQESYTYHIDDISSVEFTNGIVINFTDSGTYNKPLLVQGVGTAIYFVDAVEFNPALDQDYITIEPGAVDGNPWSLSNQWIHKDAISVMAVLLGDVTAITSEQAKRPILEFRKEIELYDFGNTLIGNVDYATTTKFQNLNGLSASGVTIDGNDIVDGETLIFLNDKNTAVEYDNVNSFTAEDPGYNFKMQTPFTDQSDMFVVVRRPLGGTDYQVFYNPHWYSKVDEDNILSFSVYTIRNPDENFTQSGTGIKTSFDMNLSLITDTTSVEVTVDSAILNEDLYSYNANGNVLTVVLDTAPPLGVSNVEFVVSDLIEGLKDGTELLPAEQDIVDVYFQSNVTEYDQLVTLVTDTLVFPTSITSVTSDNIIGVKTVDSDGVDIYDYLEGISDNSFVSLLTYSGDEVTVNFVSNLSIGDTVTLITKEEVDIVLNVNDYRWEIDIQEGDILKFLPFPSFEETVLAGDAVDILSGDTYTGNRFYKTNDNTWKLSDEQIKTGVNIAPLFNLYYTLLDSSGDAISLTDATEFNSSSTFSGSEIFSYKIDPNGSVDQYLGFATEFKNLGQTADVLFEHDLVTQRYYYTPAGESLTEIPGYYYFKEVVGPDISYNHTWVPSETESQLKVIDRYVMQDISIDSFELSVVPVELSEGIYQVSAQLESTTLIIGAEPTGSEDVTWDFYVLVDTTTNIATAYLTGLSQVEADDVIEFRTYSLETLDNNKIGYYEIPKQLENNPNNKEVTEYTANELSQHFVSIIANQEGFTGNSFGSNNYRDTEQDLSLGTFILQTQGPILKNLLSISVDELDTVDAIRFSKLEYTRYKDRLVKTANQMSRAGFTPANIPFITDSEQFFNEAILRVSTTAEYFGAFTDSYMVNWGNNASTEVFKSPLYVNPTAGEEVISATGIMILTTTSDIDSLINGVLIFQDGIMLQRDVSYTILSGSEIQLLSYDENEDIEYQVRIFEDASPAVIPTTPSFLGGYQTYLPEIRLDTTYVDATYVIIGHDGSKTPMYSNAGSIEEYLDNGTDSLDKRDVVLLGLENRIYNNTIDLFRNEYQSIYSEVDITPGAFRDVRYTTDEYNDIFISDFLKWSQRINANYKIHSEYNVADYKTWNYRDDNPSLPGHWKGIYSHFYDSLEPGKRPWEMLGFSIQPTWWETQYGTDYGNTNIAMWTDLQNGFIRDGERTGTDIRYVRTDLLDIIPVDAAGDNLAPEIIGIAVEPTADNRDAPWIFGDHAPVEQAWRNMPQYRFVVLENEFLMHPGIFGEIIWNTGEIRKAPIQPAQIISFNNFTRQSNNELYVHSEIVNSETLIKFGYQRYISDYVKFKGMDVTANFGNFLRNLNVKLGHRLAGFTNQDTLRVLVEGTSSGSSNASLTIPDENINVLVHKGKAIKEYVYSGVMIRITTDNEYQVTGYDILTPEFTMYGRDPNALSQTLDIGGQPVSFKDFVSGETFFAGEYVRYNTQFYLSNDNQTVDNFADGNWALQSALPVVGGTSVSYNATPDLNNEIIVEYGSIFTTLQGLFDFLIGYGDWLEAEGWKFDNVDADINVIENWLNTAKDAMFWATINWNEGNTLFVSPGSSQINLEVSEGYPDNVERIVNGVYSIIDANGYAIAPENTLINRNEKRIEVSHKNESFGIYALRVSAKETEHLIAFDNTSVFNDIVYDPILMSRQDKLEIIGYRTLGWFGKFEAAGYLIRDNKLIQNYENITESFRDYYSTENSLDNPNIEDTARHLIGYENREYLENLKMFDDTQYQFYKGMIPEKGSIQPVDKILRSDFIRSDSQIQIYEDWAFKVGEFGAVNDNVYLEFLFGQGDLKTDPQLVHLSYPEGPANTGVVSSIIITNAEVTYAEAPDIAITAPDIVSGLEIETAVAKAVLDSTGMLESITVVIPGYGYNNAPIVSILIDGIATNDTAIALIRNEVSVTTNDNDDIVIDIDDTDKWLTRPFGRNFDNFIPTTTFSDINTPVQNAGYVHLDDVDFTVYNINDLFELVDITNPANDWNEDEYIWVADASDEGQAWSVYQYNKHVASNIDFSLPLNNIENTIFIEGVQYSYSPTISETLFDITEVVNSANETLTTGLALAADAVNFSDTTWAVPVRLEDTGNIEETIFYNGLSYSSSTQHNWQNKFLQNGVNSQLIADPQGNVAVSGSFSTTESETISDIVQFPSMPVYRLKMFAESIYGYPGATARNEDLDWGGVTTALGLVSNGIDESSIFYDRNTDDGELIFQYASYWNKANGTTDFNWEPKLSKELDSTVWEGSSNNVDSIGNPLWDVSGEFSFTIQDNPDYYFWTGAEYQNATNPSSAAPITHSNSVEYEVWAYDPANPPYLPQYFWTSDPRWVRINSSTSFAITEDDVGTIIEKPVSFSLTESQLDYAMFFLIADTSDRFVNQDALLPQYNDDTSIIDSNANITDFPRVTGGLKLQVSTLVFRKGTNIDVTPDIALNSVATAFLDNKRYDTVIAAEAAGETKFWADNNEGLGWYFAAGTGTIRQEEPLVNTNLFSSSFAYDPVTTETILNIPIYDPFKGIIPGIVERNLKWKSNTDPARYSSESAAAASLVDDNLTFNDSQVGKIWWDTSTAKYMYYEQGDSVYRKDNWGKLFPGSTVDLYEWVKNPFLPADYDGTGTPRNETDYVVKEIYNSKFSKFDTYYYYWVKDVTVIPPNLPARSMSALNAARLLQDPRTQGYAWFSFVTIDDFVFNNINVFLKDRDSIFQINYRFKETENPKHVEWELISEGNPSSSVNAKFWNKMVDSLTGYDTNSNLVPDPNLSSHESYGIADQPRQSMFIDIYAARQIFVESANPLLAEVNLRDQDNWDDSLISTNVYWEFIDWYEAGYSATNTVPSLQIDSETTTDGPPAPPELTLEQKNALSDGDIVKVFELNNSAYYQYNETAGLAQDLVRREKTAMDLKDTLYADVILVSLSNELREILDTMRTVIFINDYEVSQNNLYFSIINYVAFEQKHVDWFFKTTYLDVVQEGQPLTSQPEFFKNDVVGSFLDYLNEVKPYQTKVRDYSVTLGASLDETTMLAFDMDSLTYTTDSEGATIPVIDPVYDPNAVPRYIDIFSAYDDVQSGFTDKTIFLETGHQAAIVNVDDTTYTFAVTPEYFDVYLNETLLSPATDYTVVTNTDLTMEITLLVTLDDGFLKVEEYQVTDGSATSYTFKTIPNVYRLTIVNEEDGELGTAQQVLPGEYNVSIDTVNNDLLTITFIDPEISIISSGRKIKVVSGTEFTHTAVEEMRLMYNTYRYQSNASVTNENNTTDIRYVTFDLDIAEDDNYIGWGTNIYQDFSWGVDGGQATIPEFRFGDQSGWNPLKEGIWNNLSWNQISGRVNNTASKPIFIMYGGAANRFLQFQGSNITDPIFRFPSNDEIITYSSYTERGGLNPVTNDELTAVAEFNVLYETQYETYFNGIFLDAEEFDFINREQWDSSSWDSSSWDARSPEQILTPAIPLDTDFEANYTGDNSTTSLRIPYVVTVVRVSVDLVILVEGVDYTVNYASTEVPYGTVIELTSTPVLDASIVVTYNYNEVDFDVDNSLTAIDGGFLAPQPYDAGVTEELAEYRLSEGLVLIYYYNSGDDLYPDGTFSGYIEFISEYEHTEFISIEPETTTKIAAEVDMNAKLIEVDDAVVLGTASFEEPGVVWIGSERITFTGVDGNTLSGVRRTTEGTTIDASRDLSSGKGITTYPIGKLVHANINMSAPDIILDGDAEPPKAPSLWYSYSGFDVNALAEDIWVNNGADQTNDYDLVLSNGADITSIPNQVDSRPSVTNDAATGYLAMNTPYDISDQNKSVFIVYKKRQSSNGYLTYNAPVGDNTEPDYVILDTAIDGTTNNVEVDFTYGAVKGLENYYQNSQPFQDPCWDANVNVFTQSEVLDIATNGGIICFYTGSNPDGSDGYTVSVEADQAEFTDIYNNWPVIAPVPVRVWVVFGEIPQVSSTESLSYENDIDWISININDATNTIDTVYGSSDVNQSSTLFPVGSNANINGFFDNQNATNGMIGEIYEIIVYGRTLTSDELADVNYFLSQKWGPYMSVLGSYPDPSI